LPPPRASWQSEGLDQKYTHLAMVDIIDAYNIAHPRA
jgi:hypothetical protein